MDDLGEPIASATEALVTREGRRLAVSIDPTPGAVGDELRWLTAWPKPGLPDAFRWLGLADDAAWQEVVVAAHKRFPDHWAAGIAYRP
jgi:hypothetical protein